MKKSQTWLKAGGIIGMAILAARVTKTPLVSILSAVPLLIKTFRSLEETRQNSTAQNTTMTRDEAALILGVHILSTDQDIREAHRKLIQKNHPDSGGSQYLAAKINQARDILLKR